MSDRDELSSEPEFVAYVGVSDLHDGEILHVSREGTSACVLVKGYSGREYEIRFEGVAAIEMFEPEGMDVYALTEMRAEAPLRRFDFANNDEEDQKVLSLLALDFCVA